MDIAQNGGGTTEETQVVSQGGDHSEGSTTPEVVKQDGETVEGTGRKPSLDEIESYRRMQRELNLKADAEAKAKADAEYWRKQWEGKASEAEVVRQQEREEAERLRRENEEFKKKQLVAESRAIYDKLTTEEFPEFKGVDLELVGDEEAIRATLTEFKEKLAEPMKKNILGSTKDSGPEPSSPAAGTQGATEESIAVLRSLDSKEKKKDYIRRILGNKTLRDIR